MDKLLEMVEVKMEERRDRRGGRVVFGISVLCTRCAFVCLARKLGGSHFTSHRGATSALVRGTYKRRYQRVSNRHTGTRRAKVTPKTIFGLS